MDNELKIIFVEDLPSDNELAKREIKKAGIHFSSVRVETKDELINALEYIQPDIVISDYSMPLFDGMSALKLCYEFNPLLPFIILTGSMNEQTAVECMKAGASDYVIKEHITRLPFAIKDALENKKLLIEKENALSMLKESENRYKLIVDNLFAGILIQIENHIVFANKAITELLLYEDENFFMDKSLKDFIHPDDLSSGFDLNQFINKPNSQNSLEQNRLIRMDGTILFAEISSTPISYYGKNAVMIIIHDITERNLAEKELIKLSTAVKQSPNSIVITDDEGFIEYANPITFDLTGYTQEEVVGKHTRIFSSGETPKEEYKQLWESIQAGQNWHGEFHNKKKDNTLFWEHASISPIINKHGKITNYIAIKEDITERKSYLDTLEKAKQKAEEGDRLKTAFLHNISHEIRTPLNGILGFSNIISQPNISQEDKNSCIEMLQQSSDRLLATITNYVDISLIVSNNIKINQKEIDFNTILKRIIVKNEKNCIIKKLECKQNIAKTENIKILSDADLIDKILSHIISNAIKFTNSGYVSIETSLVNNTIICSIEDTGIGIHTEAQEFIFNSFTQERSDDTRDNEGSGLGLSIAKNLVEILNGTIELQSKAGFGTKITISLPTNLNLEVEQTALINKVANSDSLAILVAEDDEINTFYIKNILELKAKAKIYYAVNGLEAVQLYQQHRDIGVVLMDIKMPIMNGLEAAKNIKSIDPSVKIIALTAYAMNDEEYEIRNKSCDDYLTKPIDTTLLFQKLVQYGIQTKS